MTGKGCVYTEAIDRTLQARRNAGKSIGFSVMPFRDNLNVFYKNCLSLYFRENFGDRVGLQRADDVRRPGIIICEGVCKRIQESDFVTVDVSSPNPNVFYELGIAYGIRHKIFVIHHDASEFGRQIAEQLRPLGCRAYSYHDLDPIPLEDFDRAQNAWHYELDHQPPPSQGQIVLYEHSLTSLPTPSSDKNDISLRFNAHVRSATHLAVAKVIESLKRSNSPHHVVSRYLEIIEKFQHAVDIKTEAILTEVKAQIDAAYCLIIRTGFEDCHPLSYFWLGYGHALGKNVVPVTVLRDRDETVKDLAFDIRAQRHMFFIERSPERFEEELWSSLQQMIVADFSDWSRKHFWDLMLGRRGEVSIFTAALHIEALQREMIGDWDLRAAAELTSYFASKQYRAKIENPVYTLEFAQRNGDISREDYVATLKSLLKGKNCILIASPDVNPLTEVILGSAFGVPDNLLFENAPDDTGAFPSAMVAIKERSASSLDENSAKRFFHRAIQKGSEGQLRRGFSSPLLVSGEVLKPFISQTDLSQRKFVVLGHLMILKNPFVAEGDSIQKFIIVLNGVSGPATFALTHALTGGVTPEFVAYPADFDAEAESEKILSKLLQELAAPNWRSADFLIDVHAGPDTQQSADLGSKTSDWRRILGWSLNEDARESSIKTYSSSNRSNMAAGFPVTTDVSARGASSGV